jgi:thymidine phosphorylase
VNETLDLLAGEGPADLREITYLLCREVAALHGEALDDARLDAVVKSGAARERFLRWAESQGASPAWLRDPQLPIATVEHALLAPHEGWLAAVDCRQLGLLLVEAGAGRAHAGDAIDPQVSLRCAARLGDHVSRGEPLARLYLRRRDDELAARFAGCFTLADEPVAAPPLLHARIA